jgi:hypothetical protein
VTDGTHTATIALSGNYLASSFVASNDGHGGVDIIDPPVASASTGVSTVSSATEEGVSGTITFTGVDASHSLTPSVAVEDTHYAVNFSLTSVGAGSGTESISFQFSLGNDQINIPAGEALSQSYNVGLADAQNPAVSLHQTVSVSIGGPSNDNFIFHPGIGADTIVNFNSQHDTIELDNFVNAQSMQQLQALVTTDVHGDAVINLGNHDSITVANVPVADLHSNNFAFHPAIIG